MQQRVDGHSDLDNSSPSVDCHSALAKTVAVVAAATNTGGDTSDAPVESNCPISVDGHSAPAEGVTPHSSRITPIAVTTTADDTNDAPVAECSDGALPSMEGITPCSSRDMLTTAVNTDDHSAACIGKASEPIGAYTSNAKGITWNM